VRSGASGGVRPGTVALTRAPGVDQLAVRLAGAAIGVLCLEASVFQVALPVMCACVLAALETVWPTQAPAAWIVRRLGRRPVRWVAVRIVRVGQGALAALCAAALAADAAGASGVCWVVSAAVGVLALLATVSGRPVIGVLATASRRGASEGDHT
jgi:hypothetical protein